MILITVLFSLDVIHLLSFASLSSYQSAIRVIIVKFQYEAFNIATLIKLDEITICIVLIVVKLA